MALALPTRRIVYLEEGDWAVVRASGASIRDAAGKEAQREIKETALSGAAIGKGNHRHFMKKEIFEQPAVIGDTLMAHFNPVTRKRAILLHLPFDLWGLDRAHDDHRLRHVPITPASSRGYWIEQIARVPCDVDIASEFRYRAPDMQKGGLALFISAKERRDRRHARGAALCQIAAATHRRRGGPGPGKLDRARSRCCGGWRRSPGRRLGVASTKAFTTQLVVLAWPAPSTRWRGRASKIDKEREAARSTALPPKCRVARQRS